MMNSSNISSMKGAEYQPTKYQPIKYQPIKYQPARARTPYRSISVNMRILCSSLAGQIVSAYCSSRLVHDIATPTIPIFDYQGQVHYLLVTCYAGLCNQKCKHTVHKSQDRKYR
eukprot:GHUV01050681.1.p1 GENE.GHUV01050681.1~~GHUV01050681.1.p1  ORF type:complete len:114 (-),score=11.87 GHUV01050681.1:116-457(-)